MAARGGRPFDRGGDVGAARVRPCHRGNSLAATAAGAPFPDLVRALSLEPARLADTFLPLPTGASSRIAHVTGAQAAGTPGDIYNAPYGRAPAHPASGIVATVRDLLRFGLAFAPVSRHPLLSEAARRAMMSDQVGAGSHAEPAWPPPGTLPAWGLGFMVK